MSRLRALPFLTGAAALLLVVGLSVSPSAVAVSQAGEAPFSTPPGLTLVDVANGASMFGFRRIGDAEGKPLFALKRDPAGKVLCADACARDFSPFAASPDAVSYDAWTLADAEGGLRQWAYQGQPLYRYTGSRPIEEMIASRDDDPWRVVSFRPDLSARAPSGLKVQSLEVAAGYGLVDAASGAVMYNLASAPKDPDAWDPVYAPAMALPSGDFTITQREDGTSQWAYRGRALYTFRGDYSPGDINGAFADASARPALVVRHFMPDEVKITKAVTRGPLMVTTGNLTLYTQGQYRLQYGGRSTRDGYYLSYDNAKTVGVRGCVNDCLKTWHPVAAPAGAQPRGFWEVAVRSDGTRQWVYKGAALYTYVDDKKLGDMYGNNRHDIVYGDPVNDSIDLIPSGGVPADPVIYERGFGSGFYWHHVMLYTQSVEKESSTASLLE